MPEATQIFTTGCPGPHFGQFSVILGNLSVVVAAERLLDQVRHCLVLSSISNCRALGLLKYFIANSGQVARLSIITRSARMKWNLRVPLLRDCLCHCRRVRKK